MAIPKSCYMHRLFARPPVLLLFCLACCACSGKQTPLYPVHGQVLVSGKPARGAIVVFHPLDAADPKVIKPHATVGRDGTFRLFSYRADDGAPAGNYAVTIVWQQPRIRGGGDPPPIDIERMQAWKEKAAEWRAKNPKTKPGARSRPGSWVARTDPVPARYGNPQTSGLRVEVAPGTNDLPPFNLSK